VRCASPWCLILGEGLETVLSVYAAMVRLGRPLDGIAFWAAGDLGNLAGAADGTERHPTLKTATGRPRRVPGAVPSLESKAVTIPAAMQRAEARHAREGRRITVAWPEPGRDFNDMRMPAEVA